MKKILLLQAILITSILNSQTYRQQNFDHTIHGLTTIVSIIQTRASVQYYSSYGTGFFYHKYKKPVSPLTLHSATNAIDTSLKDIWLITNKHVLFGKENYQKSQPAFPAALEFYIRKRIVGKENPVWDTIRIKNSDLVKRTKMHVDSLVDVVAINVTKEVLILLGKGDSLYYYSAVSEANFPHPDMFIGMTHGTTTGTDVLTIGYPRKFYDTYNLFPTVKAGIIASKWKAKYEGRPFFLIDCKLFPGSSGSLVISNYATYGTQDNKNYDWFEFLGVYSGELYRERETMELDDLTITRRENYNTGNVWYYYLVEEIIK